MVEDPKPFPNTRAFGWLADIEVGVISDGLGPSRELVECLRREGVHFARAEDLAAPDVILIDLVDSDRRRAETLGGGAGNAPSPVIAAVSVDHLQAPDLSLKADDFIVVPWRVGELALRIRRRLERAGPADDPGVIRVEDLVIDSNRYDVFLAGKPVLLTFKEYELLKLLASTPGRVYSREALLEQVWGYQYFGGTRTVDVHIRRLRSKIEDATHTFIDTVWNVGYRFRG